MTLLNLLVILLTLINLLLFIVNILREFGDNEKNSIIFGLVMIGNVLLGLNYLGF